MNNTAVTLKFDESEFDRLQESLVNLDSKLSAIAMFDLSGLGDKVSHGHYLLIEDIARQFHEISQSLNSAIM